MQETIAGCRGVAVKSEVFVTVVIAEYLLLLQSRAIKCAL